MFLLAGFQQAGLAPAQSELGERLVADILWAMSRVIIASAALVAIASAWVAVAPEKYLPRGGASRQR